MKFRILMLSLLLAALLFSCSGPKQKAAPAPVELPPALPGYMEYFERAKTAYDINDFREAIALFRRSIEINPEYVPALEFLGSAYLATGDYDSSQEMFESATLLNAYSVTSQIGLGRIHIKRKQPELALEYLDTAIRIENNAAEAYFYRGIALREQGFQFRSKMSFIRAVTYDETYRSTVSGIIDLGNDETVKLFQREYLEIEGSETASRAQVAALIVSIIPDKEILEDKSIGARFITPGASGADLRFDDVPDTYWAVNEIKTAVDAGLMEVYPDNTFKPEAPVTKADLAGILQTIIARQYNDQSIMTRFIGRQSPYSDVNSAHWAYNAARLTSEMGLLVPESSRVFGLRNSVSGLSAVQAFEKTIMSGKN